MILTVRHIAVNLPRYYNIESYKCKKKILRPFYFSFKYKIRDQLIDDKNGIVKKHYRKKSLETMSLSVKFNY